MVCVATQTLLAGSISSFVNVLISAVFPQILIFILNALIHDNTRYGHCGCYASFSMLVNPAVKRQIESETREKHADPVVIWTCGYLGLIMTLRIIS